MPLPRLHQPTIIETATREDWMAMRSGTIGASESAALIECVAAECGVPAEEEGEAVGIDEAGEIVSPYQSPYTLWLLKTGRLRPEQTPTNNRIAWGNRLEAIIAETVAANNGWVLRKPAGYMLHPEIPRMGASLDYEVLYPDKDDPQNQDLAEFIPAEIKNVTDTWKWKDAAGSWAVPAHIRIQVQHQMAVAGARKAVVIALFLGSEERVFLEERDDEMIAEIESAVVEFLSYIDLNIEPQPSFERDGWAIRKVLAQGDAAAAALDWSQDQESLALVAAWRAAADAAAEQKKTAERLRDELLHRIGEIEAADLGDGQRLTAKTQYVAESVRKASTFRVLRLAKAKSAPKR